MSPLSKARPLMDQDVFNELIQRLNQLHECKVQPIRPQGAFQENALKHNLSVLEAELQAYAQRRLGARQSARLSEDGSQRRSFSNEPAGIAPPQREFAAILQKNVGLAPREERNLRSEIEKLRLEMAAMPGLIAKLSTNPFAASAELSCEIKALGKRIDALAPPASPLADSARLAAEVQELAALIKANAEPGRNEVLLKIQNALQSLTAKVKEDSAVTLSEGRQFAEVNTALLAKVEAMAPKVESAILALQSQLAGLPNIIARDLTHNLEKSEKAAFSISSLEKKLDALPQYWKEAAQAAGRHKTQSEVASEIDGALARLSEKQEASARQLQIKLKMIDGKIEKLFDKMASLEADPGQSAALQPPAAREVKPLVAFEPPLQTATPFDDESIGLIEPGLGFPGSKPENPRGNTALENLALDSTEKSQNERFPRNADARLSLAEFDAGLSRLDFIAAARRAASAASSHRKVGWPAAASMRPRALEDSKPQASILRELQLFFAKVKQLAGLALTGLILAGAFYNFVQYGRSDEVDPHTQIEVQANTPPASKALPPQTEDGRKSVAKLVVDTQFFDPGVQESRFVAPSKSISGADPIAMTTFGQTGQFIVASLNPPPHDSSQEIDHLKAQAEAGNAVAQYDLASRFAAGRGLPRDPKMALCWFDKSANQGLAPAQYRLASIYEKGLGITRDLALAALWYQRAADKGNVHAMHNLGVLAADGDDGRPDYINAALWFSKAAAYGEGDSQYNLAILLTRGLGVPQNFVKAYAWFAIAAALGDAEAGKKRDEVAARLSSGELQAGKNVAASFLALPRDNAANEVELPPKGWAPPAPQIAKVSGL